MSVHRATVVWTGEDAPAFAANRYSRVHRILFEGGVEVAGSASPQVVRPPLASAEALDPEAMFTAALSACHMLWFLDLARRAGLVVSSYRDEAEGTLGRVAAAKMAMTRVVLRPKVAFEGAAAAPPALAALHAAAHEACFIANSVTTEVMVELEEAGQA